MAKRWMGALAERIYSEVLGFLGVAFALSACAGPAWAVDVAAAPEINPGWAGSALTLLAGATLLLRERLRAR